jgi:hypothetical protein
MKLGLVVPDAHIKEGQDLSRFQALGHAIYERKPDYILLGGDFVDMQVLSAWDANNKLLLEEGHRYGHEMEAANVALDMIMNPIVALQEKNRKEKKKLYNPDLWYLGGNHEDRERRYLEQHPQLVGMLDHKQHLNLSERGFEYVDYRDYIEIDGVMYTHVPMNAGNQPVSGKYSMFRAGEMLNTSIVYFHTHALGNVTYTRHMMDSPNFVLNAGCFFEHTDKYATGAPNNYWRGVLWMYHTGDNEFDYEIMRISRLRETYG